VNLMVMNLIRHVQHASFGDKRQVQWLSDRVILSGRILDVCCGPGFYAYHLLKERDDVEYIGVDKDSEYIRQASLFFLLRRRTGDFRMGDAHSLCFPSWSFDQVWLFNWWVTGNDAVVLRECFRVLRDGGSLLVNHPINHSFFIDNSLLYRLFYKVDSLEICLRDKHSLRYDRYRYLLMGKNAGAR